MTKGIELRHLSYFVAIAEEAHFGRASLRLRIAQPSLSVALRELEDRLGVELIDRSDRRAIRLTNAGESLLVHSRDILRSVDDAISNAQAAARASSGQLLVGYNDGEPLARHSGLLGSAMSKRGIDVAFRRLTWGTEGDAVRTGKIDIVMAKLPIDAHGLGCEVVASEPRLVCLRADHDLAVRDALDLTALRGEPVVRPTGGLPSWVDFWRGLPRPDGHTPPDGPHTFGPEDTFEAVASGTAICFVPASMVATIPGHQFRFVPVTDLPPVETAVLWSSERKRPAQLDAFIEAVRHVLTEHPRGESTA